MSPRDFLLCEACDQHTVCVPSLLRLSSQSIQVVLLLIVLNLANNVFQIALENADIPFPIQVFPIISLMTIMAPNWDWLDTDHLTLHVLLGIMAKVMLITQ